MGEKMEKMEIIVRREDVDGTRGMVGRVWSGDGESV